MMSNVSTYPEPFFQLFESWNDSEYVLPVMWWKLASHASRPEYHQMVVYPKATILILIVYPNLDRRLQKSTSLAKISSLAQ